MKRIAFILFCLGLFPYLCFSQDSIRSNKNFQISLSTGAYYKSYVGDKHVKPIYSSQSDGFNSQSDIFSQNQYEHFTKMPAFGFFEGLLFKLKNNKNWYWTFGLMYENRRTILTANPDSINYSSDGIPDVIGYNYSNNNVEALILINYKTGNFNISGGVRIALINFRKTTFTYLIAQQSYQKTGIYGERQKVVRDIRVPLLFKNNNLYDNIFYATIQASYDLQLGELPISPFIGLDIDAMRGFYLNVGLEITLK